MEIVCSILTGISQMLSKGEKFYFNQTEATFLTNDDFNHKETVALDKIQILSREYFEKIKEKDIMEAADQEEAIAEGREET